MQKIKASQIDISDKKILIVDDQKQNVALLRDMLSDLGYRMSFAFSGKAAFELCQQDPPDLILLDINMPEVGGIKTCELLKDEVGLAHIPVIFVTGNTDVRSLVKAFDVGASDFISKPVRPEELAARVRTHLLVSAFQHALTVANEKLDGLAKTDQLTGVSNRRAFEERALLEWNRARRDGSCLGLLMIDIDYFKLYNDHYGHQAGDLALTVVAQTMQDTLLRATDLFARYGGEEFAVVLSNTDADGIKIVAQRVLLAIQELEMAHDKSPFGMISISVGAFSGKASETQTIREFVKLADQALYKAKREGRNRTSIKMI